MIGLNGDVPKQAARLAALRHEPAVVAAAHSLSALFVELFENATIRSAVAQTATGDHEPWLRKHGVFRDERGIRQALTADC